MDKEERILQVLDTLTTSIAKLEAGQAAMQTDITGMKADITGVKAEITGMKGEITGVKAEITGVKADINELKIGQAETNKRLGIIESEIKELKDVDQFINNLALDIHESAEKNHNEVIKKLDIISRVAQKNSFDINELQTRAV